MNESPPPAMAAATAGHTIVSVCVTCRQRINVAPGYIEPGRALLAALEQRLAGSGVTVVAAQCFAVCTRPCTISLQASGKWAQITGDLTLSHDLDAIVEAALVYASTADGIIPWAQTPLAFCKGSVARLPPPPPLE